MRAAFALRIVSGIIIFNFGVQESLRTFLNPIFTAGVAKAIGSFQRLFTVATFPVKRQFQNCK
jgi:hypothetical protein